MKHKKLDLSYSVGVEAPETIDIFADSLQGAGLVISTFTCWFEAVNVERLIEIS